jgi:hypothetical protein
MFCGPTDCRRHILSRELSAARPIRRPSALGVAATLAIALAASPPVPSLAADQPIAEKPVYKDGDTFEYVDRYETIPCQRWEIKGRDADGSLLSQCNDNIAYFSAETGSLLRIARKDGKDLVKFQPAAPEIPFPLQVGTKWGGKFEVSTTEDLVTPGLDESCEVTAFETIRVAAGELPAFRFDCTTRWTVWPLHGHVTETGWYSPTAKTLVKVINNSDPKWNLELARYSFK